MNHLNEHYDLLKNPEIKIIMNRFLMNGTNSKKKNFRKNKKKKLFFLTILHGKKNQYLNSHRG